MRKKGSATFAVKGWKYPRGPAILLTQFGLLSQEVYGNGWTRELTWSGAPLLWNREILAEGIDLLESAVQSSQYGNGMVLFAGIRYLGQCLGAARGMGAGFQGAGRSLQQEDLYSARRAQRFYGLESSGRLAEVYRNLGRDEEARRIEEELLKLLTYADPDHPILLRLQSSQE